jgi:hypothetical protein
MGGWVKEDPPTQDSSYTRFFHSHNNSQESSVKPQIAASGNTVREENKAGTRRVIVVFVGHGRVDTMLGRKKSGLARDTRGVVAVEYVMILVMFVVPSIGAISYEGTVVYQQYKDTRSVIVMPIP